MNQEQTTKFAEYIRQRREEKGLSARALARISGVDLATILRLEKGSAFVPRPATLRALAEALDVPLSDLYALADYVLPTELPNFSPYLRAKYSDLPPAALADLDQAFGQIAKRYGYDGNGPAEGQDEI